RSERRARRRTRRLRSEGILMFPALRKDSCRYIDRAANGPKLGRATWPRPSNLFLFRRNEDFAFSCMVCRPDNAFLLHTLDDGSSTVVADAEPALDIAR